MTSTEVPGFKAELRDALTPRALLLVVAVMGLQLGFILSYIGAFHSPSPHRVRIAVVAPSQVSSQILGQLNGLPGEPLSAVSTADEASARKAIVERKAGAAIAQVSTDIAKKIEASQRRQVTVEDILPPGAGTTAVRNTVYFNGNAIGGALTVLACYAVVGTVVAILAAQFTKRPAHT